MTSIPPPQQPVHPYTRLKRSLPKHLKFKLYLKAREFAQRSACLTELIDRPKFFVDSMGRIYQEPSLKGTFVANMSGKIYSGR